VPRGVTVTTHQLVLNPRAPNGARGDNPEVPPNLAAGAGLQQLQQQLQQNQQNQQGQQGQQGQQAQPGQPAGVRQ
jgi:hypothetical protein